nr:hypothetical protein [Paracoccus aminovorans]
MAYLPLDQVQHDLDEGRLVRVLSRFTSDLPGHHPYYPHRRHASSVFTLLVEALQRHWILDGIDIDAMVRHPVRQYRLAG